MEILRRNKGRHLGRALLMPDSNKEFVIITYSNPLSGNNRSKTTFGKSFSAETTTDENPTAV
jgi:hypothetical protein